MPRRHAARSEQRALHLEDLGDDLLHHLVGPAADADQPRVDEGARGGILPAVARAAEELHARVGDELLDGGAEHLGHRDVERRVLAANHLPDAAAGELLGGRDLDHHVDELVLVHLHLRERLAEDDALLGVLERRLPHLSRDDRRHDDRHHAFVLKLVHLLLEATVRVADRVRQRDAHVLEEEEAGVRALVPDLVEQLVGEPGPVRRDDDLAEAAVAGFRIRHGEETEPVRKGDEWVINGSKMFITNASPLRTARVLMAATSEPAPGSVTAMAPTCSPRIAGVRYFRLSASLPKRARAGVAMSVCTLMPIATPALSQSASSSRKTAW